MAADIVRLLREHGLVDEEGYLSEDPRKTRRVWGELLAPVVDGLSLEADTSHVAEVRGGGKGAGALESLQPRRPCPARPSSPPLQLLNVAYARHELVGDTTDVSLAWLEAGGQEGIEELLVATGEADERRRAAVR
jgi:hypothetical protein